MSVAAGGAGEVALRRFDVPETPMSLPACPFEPGLGDEVGLAGFTREPSTCLQFVGTGRITGSRTPGATARPCRHHRNGRISAPCGDALVVFTKHKQHRVIDLIALNASWEETMANTRPTQSKVDLPKTYTKIYLHILPYLFVCYLFNYFDRVNVGFGKLQMLDDLHLTETVYGLAAGIFFIGYVLFGVPSNLVLYRVGARRWLAALMIIWGIFSTSLMFVTSARSFYILRFLTGASEAGFFPGIILYFTLWVPSAQRGRITALFMSAIPISGVLGSPFSGWVLHAFSTGVAVLPAGSGSTWFKACRRSCSPSGCCSC